MRKEAMLDTLLLPVEMYKKISPGKNTLYLGMLFIGLVDIIPFLTDNYKALLNGKSATTLLSILALTGLLMLLIGLIDVALFSLPLLGIVKHVKKKKEVYDRTNTAVKVMKVYILHHLAILPVNFFILYLVKRYGMENLPISLAYLISYVALVIPNWSAAAITRGLNTMFTFTLMEKIRVFFLISIWNWFFGQALIYVIDNMAGMLLKIKL